MAHRGYCGCPLYCGSIALHGVTAAILIVNLRLLDRAAAKGKCPDYGCSPPPKRFRCLHNGAGRLRSAADRALQDDPNQPNGDDSQTGCKNLDPVASVPSSRAHILPP